MRQSDLALSVALLSWMLTLFGYFYGHSDHLEHLPMVFRAMDSSYLLSDAFVQATDIDEVFNPRYFYIKSLSLLAQLLPLPFWALLFTFLSNWAIAWGAARMALIFFEDRKAAFLAALFCLCLPVPAFGSTDSLQSDYLLQGYVCFAFWVHALLDGLEKKYRRMALLLFLAAVAHPLMGLALGGLHLALLWPLRPSIRKVSAYWWAVAAYVLAAALQVGPYLAQAGTRLSEADFLNIHVHFRHPHHFLASHFLNPEQQSDAWQGAAVLLLGLLHLLSSKPGQALHRWLLLWLLTLGGLALGAYYFVEIQPSRLWATLQGYRLLVLVKWWMLILAAGLAARALRYGPVLLLALPLGLFAVHLAVLPYGLAAVFLYVRIEKYLSKKSQAYGFAITLALPLLVWGYWESQTAWEQSWRLPVWWIWLGLSASLTLLNTYRKAVILLWLLALGLQLGYWLQISRSSLPANSFAAPWGRDYQLSDHQNSFTELSGFLKKQTEADALLLSPPGFSPLRLYAQRALVVDFKTFAFTDTAMQAWYERILEVYGPAHSKGFEAVRYNFVPNYQKHSVEKLRALAKKYGADYVIGYAGQELPGEQVFQTAAYQINKLNF